MPHAVRVWDLPTRVFHWSLACCVAGSVLSGQFGWMGWHLRLGYAVLALLLFRLLWGWFGGRWSRFCAFVYPPSTLVRYLRGKGAPSDAIGHSPAGALSVFAMLLALAAQIVAGFITDDEIATSGPFAALASAKLVGVASWYHTRLGKYIVLALIALHVAAILHYLLRKKTNLIRPMLNGDKIVDAGVEPSRDDRSTRARALLLLAACVAGVWLLLRLAPGD